MKKKIPDTIRSLLEKGRTEDVERELSLANHFLGNPCSNKKYHILVEGLNAGIPVPYIIGYTLIDNIKIAINKHVLHPGPETVTIIQRAIGYILKANITSVLDLCTGSGAVAVVTSKRCPATG